MAFLRKTRSLDDVVYRPADGVRNSQGQRKNNQVARHALGDVRVVQVALDGVARDEEGDGRGDEAGDHGFFGAGWMLSTQCTSSGFSTTGMSRFTTTGSWPLRQRTQERGSVSLALISWCGT